MWHDVRLRKYDPHNHSVSFGVCTEVSGVCVPTEQVIETPLVTGIIWPPEINSHYFLSNIAGTFDAGYEQNFLLSSKLPFLLNVRNLLIFSLHFLWTVFLLNFCSPELEIWSIYQEAGLFLPFKKEIFLKINVYPKLTGVISTSAWMLHKGIGNAVIFIIMIICKAHFRRLLISSSLGFFT